MNKFFLKSSEKMEEIENNSVDLIVTSPPYFNIKDYSREETDRKLNDLGSFNNFDNYINKLLVIWKECEKKLKSNGKLCINVPLMPILKKYNNKNHTRHIYDLKSHILTSIIKNTSLNLMDEIIWERTNSTKKLMFGSYPYPPNFYIQNTIEFIIIFVKPGKPKVVSKDIKVKSILTKTEWLNYTKQIWRLPIPNKKDIAFGKHSALMSEEIVKRLVKMYSFVDDLVLDPFTGSGTTLKVAKELNRNYVGYEIYDIYEDIITQKLNQNSEKI